MPDYRPPWPFTNAHVNTVYPTLLRPAPTIHPASTERIDTPDGDFLDLDWCRADTGTDSPTRGVAVISHGLEGNARKKYPLGMARALTRQGWDAVCWNFRGCSGEPNRTLRFYHSGETGDLAHVLRHALAKGYGRAALVGFSIGGNQILRYLGAQADAVPAEVAAAVAVAPPVDLTTSVHVLERLRNKPYIEYFLISLRRKIREKAQRFPDRLDPSGLKGAHTFHAFDERYTAPIFGFAGARDYYAKASSLPVLGNIRVPTLVLSAKDDPFLSPECFPVAQARANPQLYLETPAFGGHVGFVRTGNGNVYWSEERAAALIKDHAGGDA